MTSTLPDAIEPFLSSLIAWAPEQPEVVAVLLVGSYARGTATGASDVDLVVLTQCPEPFIENPGWVEQFGTLERVQREVWGVVASLRVWYEDGLEVEYGFTTPEWAAQPVDAGTRRVVSDGCRVLYDPEGVLRALLEVVSATGLVVDGPLLGQSEICEPILRALPDWFGIEEATARFVRDIDALPTFLASLDGEVVGFLTIKHHNEFSAEIHVMGVHPARHHQGAGRALVGAAEAHLRGRGVEYLQVKTLSDSHPDEGYARTRAFYLAMGFRPLQEFPELWGKENPCLQLVKGLSSGDA